MNSKMSWYFTSEWHNSCIKSGFESVVVSLTHLTFCTVEPCTSFLILPFFLSPVISLQHFLSVLIDSSLFIPNSLSSPPPSFFTETYTLWRFSPVVSRIKMTGRKSKRKRGGGVSLSWLLVVFLCMNQSPVVSTIWTNNIPSDLTSKLPLKRSWK